MYTRYRNQSYVGTEAADQTYNPGTFKTTNTGEWVGGPIVKNKLFFFESFEKQNDTRPLTTFTSNPGGAPVAGNTTRVLTSDLSRAQQLSEAELQLRHRPLRQRRQSSRPPSRG